MRKLTDVDVNFKIKSKIGKEDIRFYDVLDAPMKVFGVFYEDGKFRRLPEGVAEKTNEGVHFLHANTAGGRVRFKTDSEYIAINTKLSTIERAPHFTLTGSAGFDIYDKEKFIGSFIPPIDTEDGYESLLEFGSKEMREITINFPLYSDVCELYIGISDKAEICEPDSYKYATPIVYYGSSITQGGCASRPGDCYEAIISRRIDADYINLGFSGSARGEEEIANYIKDLKMSVFVYDYDHNAPTAEHLEKTHERMFKIIRGANAEIPIVMMTRPKYYLTSDEKKREEIVRRTYENAKASGDKNVYFIEGKKLMERVKAEGTVDNIHPNSLGMYCIAEVLGDYLENILGC